MYRTKKIRTAPVCARMRRRRHSLNEADDSNQRGLLAPTKAQAERVYMPIDETTSGFTIHTRRKLYPPRRQMEQAISHIARNRQEKICDAIRDDERTETHSCTLCMDFAPKNINEPRMQTRIVCLITRRKRPVSVRCLPDWTVPCIELTVTRFLT